MKHSLQTVGDLSNLPLIVNETDAVTLAEWLDLNNVSLPRANWLRFNRASQIIPAVLSGLGVALESLRVLAPPRELTLLHVTANPARVERATKVADLVRCECRMALGGRRTAWDKV